MKQKNKTRYANKFVTTKNIIDFRNFFKRTTNNTSLNKSNKDIYRLKKIRYTNKYIDFYCCKRI